MCVEKVTFSEFNPQILILLFLFLFYFSGVYIFHKFCSPQCTFIGQNEKETSLCSHMKWTKKNLNIKVIHDFSICKKKLSLFHSRWLIWYLLTIMPWIPLCSHNGLIFNIVFAQLTKLKSIFIIRIWMYCKTFFPCKPNRQYHKTVSDKKKREKYKGKKGKWDFSHTYIATTSTNF